MTNRDSTSTRGRAPRPSDHGRLQSVGATVWHTHASGRAAHVRGPQRTSKRATVRPTEPPECPGQLTGDLMCDTLYNDYRTPMGMNRWLQATAAETPTAGSRVREARQNEEMSSDCVYMKFKHRKSESKVLEAQGAPRGRGGRSGERGGAQGCWGATPGLELCRVPGEPSVRTQGW